MTATTDQELAFVFPGQGSQAVGMLSEWAAENDLVRATFQEASDALGHDLWTLSQQGPAEELDRTDRTQPALLTASVALWRLWREHGGPSPALMAGHSLGEYSALVCAGALDFPDAVRLVADRGRFMQEAVAEGEGAMAAILGLDAEPLAELCRTAAQGAVVEPVNFNAPGQIVIAGNREAVGRAIEAAQQAGAKRAMELPVSVPSHCSLMRPAAERLRERLDEVPLTLPDTPVLHNRTVDVCGDVACIRTRLVEQLDGPVRWSESVQALVGRGATRIAECGPGKVLSGLIRRIDRSVQTVALGEPAAFRKALDEARTA